MESVPRQERAFEPERALQPELLLSLERAFEPERAQQPGQRADAADAPLGGRRHCLARHGAAGVVTESACARRYSFATQEYSAVEAPTVINLRL